MSESPITSGSEQAEASGAPFFRQPRTWVRIAWVALRLSAAVLLANKVDPFFYQGF